MSMGLATDRPAEKVTTDTTRAEAAALLASVAGECRSTRDEPLIAFAEEAISGLLWPDKRPSETDHEHESTSLNKATFSPLSTKSPFDRYQCQPYNAAIR